MIRDCNGIDINELNQGIYWYRKDHNGDYPSYLIMNNESFYLMKRTIDRSFPLENVLNEPRTKGRKRLFDIITF